MNGSNGVKDGSSAVVHRLAARQCGYLSTPAETIEIEFASTFVAELLSEVEETREDIIKARSGGEEGLKVFLESSCRSSCTDGWRLPFAHPSLGGAGPEGMAFCRGVGA